MISNPRSVPVQPYSQYYTYQANFQLFSREPLDNDGCFAKAILYVAGWIRDRIDMPESSGPDFLRSYPTPEKYASFDPDSIADQGQTEGFDIRIVYDKSRSIWALRLFENSDNPDARGQSFVTEVTVSKGDDSVFLAIRTTCREPMGMPPAKVYRLSFIRHGLMNDDDIILTEAFTGPGCPIGSQALSINGKSKEACSDFCEHLLTNPCRQFPLLLIANTGIYDENRELIDTYAYDMAGHAHVVILKDGPNKLCYTVMGRSDLGDALKEDSLAFAVFDPVTDDESSTPEPVFYSLEGSDTEIAQVLESAREDLVDYQRGRNYDYHETEFYSKVRVGKLISQIGDSDDFDREGMQTAVAELMEKLESSRANEIELTTKFHELQRNYEKLQKQFNKVDSDREKSELASSDSENELREKLQATEDELAAERAKNSESSLSFPPDHRALLTMPLTNDRDEILAWIEKSYCGEDGCLILHDRARDSFRRDNTNRDLLKICLMFHFLYGYTRFLNEGNDPISASQKAERYDVQGNHFEATPSGRSEGALRLHRNDYQIDISAYDPNKIEVLMDMHLKKGKGMDTDSIRIYFYYDSEIGKTIVGYMPDHLPI